MLGIDILVAKSVERPPARQQVVFSDSAVAKNEKTQDICCEPGIYAYRLQEAFSSQPTRTHGFIRVPNGALTKEGNKHIASAGRV